MHRFFAPPRRGWLLVRPTSHAVLFLDDDGAWTDTPAGARLFDHRMVAERAARRFEGAFAMPGSMTDWLKPPILTVVRRLVTA